MWLARFFRILLAILLRRKLARVPVAIHVRVK
jgi:hypothetical protein